MGKDNYINYIVLMDLTFGNQTWLAGKSPINGGFLWEIQWENSGILRFAMWKKGGRTPAVIIKLVYDCLWYAVSSICV